MAKKRLRGQHRLLRSSAMSTVTRCFPMTDTDMVSFADVFCGAGP